MIYLKQFNKSDLKQRLKSPDRIWEITSICPMNVVKVKRLKDAGLYFITNNMLRIISCH